MAENSERELVRAVLANPNVLADVIDNVSPRDFQNYRNQTLYTVILDAWNAGETVDATTLPIILESKNLIEAIGGYEALIDLSLGTPSSATFHAQQVRKDAELWRLNLLGKEMAQRTQTVYADPDEIRAWADEKFDAVAEESHGKLETFAATMDDTLEWLSKDDDTVYLPTGFANLDRLLNGGLRAGQMVVVAARPGRGKSVLSVDIARHAALHQGKSVAFFSLEMSKRELALRILAAETNTRLALLVQHKPEEIDWDNFTAVTDRMNDANLFIDDTPSLTMTDIRAKARQLNNRHGLDLICIDYLQLLSSGKKVESRQQEVSEFSRQVKLLAKELECPVIAVCQLNRGVEQRGDDAKPKLSDLRESGSLEQDADIVLLIDRPDAENMDHARAGEADFIIAKQRGGQIGTVTVPHLLHYAKFADSPTG